MFHTPLPTLTPDPERGFASGTRVHTRDGLKPIELVRVGDWVLTQAHDMPPPRRRRQPGEYAYRQVTSTAFAEVRSFVSLTVQNLADGIEDTVLAAKDQPIWTQPVGWLAASHVAKMQAVVLSFNGNALVQKTQWLDQAERMHSLEVEGGHTCYVGALGIWVGGHPDVAVRAAPIPEPRKAVDFSQPQVLVQIEDYYNDTLASGPAAQMLEDAEKLRGLFKAQMQLELACDEAGVRWLEGYIDRARLRSTGDPSRRNSIQLIGAFLGECIVRNIGGRWAWHDGTPCVALDEGNAVFPHSKVAKQFSNGTDGGDSILGFYQITKRLGQSLVRPALTPCQRRLVAFAGDAGKRVFVPHARDDGSLWAQVLRVDETHVVLQPLPGEGYTISLFLRDITCFYVCTDDGQLHHPEWISQARWDTLPPSILAQIQRGLPTDTSITLSQLAPGQRFVEISHGPSEAKDAEGVHHQHATTLKNVSPHKIRITRFGGFKATGASWQLASVTGDFYNADHFREWYGQADDWLLPGQTVRDDANWGSPPTLWAYHGVTDTGESFIAGQVLEKPISRQDGTGAHFVAPEPPEPEMARIIGKLRASFEQRQQRMNTITLASVLGPRPAWLTDADGLSEFYQHQALLLTEGHIVWGALVQANKLLFQPGGANCPALLVHSPDAYFDERPRELRLIGRTFFSLKETEPTDPDLKEVARLVTDELDRSMGFELPTVFSSKLVRSATFMVFRQHVPNGVLSSGLFPILTHPSTPAVMMVPFEFWPIELIVLWKENRI